MNPSLRRIAALMRKESYQILRDPSNIMIAFLLPALLLFIYSFGISLDIKHLKLGIMNRDLNGESGDLEDAFRFSSYFDVKDFSSAKEMEEALIRGEIKGFLVIPEYFSRWRLVDQIPGPVQIIADGSEPNTANFVQNYVESTFNNWKRELARESGKRSGGPVRLQPRMWYNEELESRYYLLPGSIAIIMTLIGTMLTALVIAREWERGTMEALLATPVTMREILISKLLPYFFLGLLSMLFCTVVSTLLLDVPFRGSLLALLAVSSFFLTAALGVGLFISTVARNQFVAYQAALISGFLPAFMLSGFVFEISSMPTWIRALTYLIPARYFVSSLKTLFLTGNVWPLLLKNMLAMACFGALMLTLTFKKSAKTLDT